MPAPPLLRAPETVRIRPTRARGSNAQAQNQEGAPKTAGQGGLAGRLRKTTGAGPRRVSCIGSIQLATPRCFGSSARPKEGRGLELAPARVGLAQTPKAEEGAWTF